jgi:penicillin-binding protein 2
MLSEDIRVQSWRLGVLALMIFAAVGLLLNRLWTVQVVNSDSAKQRSEEQTTVRNRIAPARGAICDRNGVMLAENRPSFDIDFYLGDLRRDYAETHKGNVPQLVVHPYYPLDQHVPRIKVGTVKSTTLNFPAPVSGWKCDDFTTDPKSTTAKMIIAYTPGDKSVAVRALTDPAEAQLTLTCAGKDYTFDLATDTEPYHWVTFYPAGTPVPKAASRRGEDDIVEIVRQSIAPIKDTLGLTAPLNEKDIREHFRTYPDLPYHYMTDLDFATVANFEERNAGVTGIRISQNPARQYTYGAFAAHILGYVGKPNKQDEHLASDNTPYETIGRHGIEAVMDAQLQGDPGSELKRVSSQGYYIEDPSLKDAAQPPTMGSTLYLTIDARVQYIVETALRHAGVGRAAAIVMDPRNGDVLAMASVPSYDPNKFIPKIQSKDWDALNQDPTAPMFNRVLHAYAPGSTYKIMVALAGLKSGNVNVNTIFNCPGAIQIDDHLFHNSDSTDAGDMALVHAICVSSDVFFYQYGIKVGMPCIEAMGKLAGFGHKWGLLGDADEDAGIMPGPEWMKTPEAQPVLKRAHIDHWSHAQTANTSIGQGFVLCTPLQMATFLCAVANGGTVYQPRLYSRVVDYKGDTKAEIPEGQVYSHLDVKPSDLKAVQEGMREVVSEGTAQLAQVPGYQLGGKTGTAQAKIRVNGETRKDLKCWFYCYGPWENPRYVTCIVVEGGVWGGTTTAPIAQEIMSRLFAMDKGAVENIAFLQPALGNFNGLGAVDTSTNPNSNGKADKTAAPAPATTGDSGDVSPNGDVQANNDAAVTAPAADAPPPSTSTPRRFRGH